MKNVIQKQSQDYMSLNQLYNEPNDNVKGNDVVIMNTRSMENSNQNTMLITGKVNSEDVLKGQPLTSDKKALDFSKDDVYGNTQTFQANQSQNSQVDHVQTRGNSIDSPVNTVPNLRNPGSTCLSNETLDRKYL